MSVQINKVHSRMKERSENGFNDVNEDEKPIFILATGDGNAHNGYSSFPDVFILSPLFLNFFIY